MQKDFERLFHRAEDHYLQAPEVGSFKKHLGLLQERLSAYRTLRDNEVAIFQAIANQLETELTDTPTASLEKALVHWLSVLRYSAMAMLLNNPEFLQYRLLEWLGDLVKAHELQTVETHLAHLLTSRLQALLSADEFKLLHPFLVQAETTILGKAQPEAPNPVLVGDQS